MKLVAVITDPRSGNRTDPRSGNRTDPRSGNRTDHAEAREILRHFVKTVPRTG